VPISQTRRRELLVEVFGGLEPPLRTGCAGWLEASPRLAEFVERHRDKIRKKLRSARDAEGRRDALAELRVAHALLSDRRCEVSYEPLLTEGGRRPDFMVAFRVNTRLAVEVARLRGGPDEAGPAAAAGPPARALAGIPARIVGVVGAKLGQCQSGVPNVVALVADGLPAGVSASAAAGGSPAQVGNGRSPDTVGSPLDDAGRRLLALAAGAEPEHLARRGFRDGADFRRQLQRLSAIWLLDGLFGAEGAPAWLWPNPRARHPLPPAVAALLGR